MKNLTKALLLVSAVLMLASCSKYKYESFKGDPTNARIYTLENGLTVYMIPNHDTPRIDAQVAVKVGSKNDPRETTGLAHYFEHLMFKGTQQFGSQNYELEKPLLDKIEALFEVYRKTEDPAERKAIYHEIDSISQEASKLAIPNEYDKLMASIGAKGTNAYTSYDVTCYVENIPSNQMELWAKVQADRFANCVLRGFHTELETIYEEYNMYAALDNQKLQNALFEGLFENHPYNTDVIGLPSHLKNPSITNVQNYHDYWYVPNNIAVVLSGDFNPDEAIKIVDKYFGQLKPNKDLKRPEYAPEKPITSPIVKEVRGNESRMMSMAWRFPGANDPENIYLSVLGSILNNGKAGLIDIDVNQQQKTLGMYAGYYSLADYSVFMMDAEPKADQSFDEVRDIFLAELDKVKAGDFDEELLTSIINNAKLSFMRMSESTGFMAREAVNCFINDCSWKDEVVDYIDRLGNVTKADIVKFANDNFKDNYVQVNKLQEKDPTDFSIEKPQITPIQANRDTASQFLKDVQAAAAAVAPIEPVFVDYAKDMEQLKSAKGLEILYKENESNGTFEIDYVFETGSSADKKLDFASDYFDFLGTSTMSPEQIKKEFYKLACSYGLTVTTDRTYVSLSGLAENMIPAMALLENLISDAQANPSALESLKENTLQERANAKHDQSSNFSRLQQYGLFGPKNPATDILSAAEIKALKDDDLLGRIRSIFNIEHKVLYYGPAKASEFVRIIDDNHKVADNRVPAAEGAVYQYAPVTENEVIIAPYDANQVRLFSCANIGKPYDKEIVPIVRLYNSYFGSGMNSIVFQEMREARGLCYSSGASYALPGDLKHTITFQDYIATQNDKVIDALAAFDDIINNMPVSEKAFDIAKESIISNIRTSRTIKSSVLWSYLNAQKLGLDYDINKDIFEKVQSYTLDDVVKFQQNNVKDLKKKCLILGRTSDLDLKALSEFGKVRQITTEEIFGF